MTEGRQPGRPRRVRCRPVPSGQNAPDHILVEGNPERQGDLVARSVYSPRSDFAVSWRRLRPSVPGWVSWGPVSSVPWTRTAGDLSASSALDGTAGEWKVSGRSRNGSAGQNNRQIGPDSGAGRNFSDHRGSSCPRIQKERYANRETAPPNLSIVRSEVQP